MSTGSTATGGSRSGRRAILGTEESIAVGFELGVLDVVARGDEASVVGHLGPDLLGPDWNAEDAVRRLTADPSREVGLALLDQGFGWALWTHPRMARTAKRKIVPVAVARPSTMSAGAPTVYA